MRYVRRYALFLSLLLPGTAPTSRADEISIVIEDAPTNGTVVFSLFDSANTFGDLRDPVRQDTFPLDGRDSYRLTDIPPGEYALLVFHDQDDNGRVDRNFIGIPKEPLGFSNGYRPKGPPSYQRAAFILDQGTPQRFTVKLSKPLGDRGRIGVGLGIIARSSPYHDYRGGVYQVIPAITYTGERFQIFGPFRQIGLAGRGKLRLAATGEYRIGAYEEDDSDILTGMGDAEGSFMVGLAVQSELPAGIDVSLSYAHDALDRIGGGEARLEIDKSFQAGIFRLAPRLGLNWMSSGLANNDFGVPADQAISGRPAYDVGSVLSSEAGLGLFVDMASDWQVIISASVEFLDTAVTESPIVSEASLVKGFGAVSYVF